MKGYTPPFTITETITNLVIEIAEKTAIISVTENLSKNPTLRRENRIQSIHSSLAIERNSLTFNQVSDVIDGKRVLGPPKDIREVQNAFEAYEIIAQLNPYKIPDLLKAHQIMMSDLVKESGVFRSKGVGVYAGESLIHAGTPPQYVPGLIEELFQWLEESSLHPLIKSCIFHYEFEFIHPFSDGNGRTGRMWHTLILSKWKNFFLWLPIESLIHERQEEYYQAINSANNKGESTVFVKFMLEIIKQALDELTEYVNNSLSLDLDTNEKRILKLIKVNNKLSAKKLAEELGLSERQVQRVLQDMKEQEIIVREGSNKNGSWRIL